MITTSVMPSLPSCSIDNFKLILQNGTPNVINANIGKYLYPEKSLKILFHFHKNDFFCSCKPKKSFKNKKSIN